MKLKVTVTRGGQSLHSEDYEVSAEGDLERAVTDAMAKARSKAGFGALWDFSIHVGKA